MCVCVCVWRGDHPGRAPVGESEDEELERGAVEEQVLVLLAELAEAGDLLRPQLDHVDRAEQDVVELVQNLRVLRVLLHFFVRKSFELKLTEGRGRRDFCVATQLAVLFDSRELFAPDLRLQLKVFKFEVLNSEN